MAAYITRTPGTAGNRKRWTLSGWFKFGMGDTANKYWGNCFFTGSNGTNYMECSVNNAGFMDWVQTTGGLNARRTTNRKFRDSTGFYNFVWVWDSDNGTAADRMKLYVNGVQETSFSATTNPSSSLDSNWNFTYPMCIGSSNGGAPFFNGVMSHVQFVDGLALAPTEFGQFDATDGMWELKTGSYGTPGAQGFHLKMEDSSNLDLDSSSNGHTFSTTGTLTPTKDNPSNNFCTLNPLKMSSDGTNTFSNGNTIFSNTGGTGWHQSGGTLAATAGKYYYEADINYTPGSSNSQFGWGATEMQQITQNLNQPLGKLDVSGGAVVNYAPSAAFYDTGAYMSSTTSSHDNQANSSFAGAASGDVIMIAIDLDNGKFYVGKNGTWDSTSSSNPNAGSGGKSFTPGGFSYSPWVASYNGAAVRINFGNGYFASTAISSPVSAGEGLWKYTPPTNYGAFCTKNINAA